MLNKHVKLFWNVGRKRKHILMTLGFYFDKILFFKTTHIL